MVRRRKAYRVDILGAPADYGANVRGVSMGPLAFRLAGLLDRLRDEGIDARDLGDVLGTAPARGGRAGLIRSQCAILCSKVEASLRRGRFPLVIGGDHSIAIGSVAGVSKYYRSKGLRLGVVWVDAHGDMNTPSTSPSGNIHGMPLAISLGSGIRDLVRIGGFHPKIEATRTALVGIRNLDPQERELIARFGVHVFTMKDVDRRGLATILEEALQLVSRGADGIHVSFDMDVVDPSVAPGVGTAVRGGLSYREAHLVMELVHDSGVLRSLDIVETNPFLDNRNATARLGVELALSALGKSIY